MVSDRRIGDYIPYNGWSSSGFTKNNMVLRKKLNEGLGGALNT